MQPDWSATSPGIPDADLTPEREQLLAMLPATMPELEEEFGVNVAQDLMQWADRTKRAKWDPHACQYVVDPRGPRR
jgi:hypothetical protein